MATGRPLRCACRMPHRSRFTRRGTAPLPAHLRRRRGRTPRASPEGCLPAGTGKQGIGRGRPGHRDCRARRDSPHRRSRGPASTCGACAGRSHRGNLKISRGQADTSSCAAADRRAAGARERPCSGPECHPVGVTLSGTAAQARLGRWRSATGRRTCAAGPQGLQGLAASPRRHATFKARCSKPMARVAWRSRRRVARGLTWTARCGGTRSATGGAGAGQGQPAPCPAGSTSPRPLLPGDLDLDG